MINKEKLSLHDLTAIYIVFKGQGRSHVANFFSTVSFLNCLNNCWSKTTDFIWFLTVFGKDIFFSDDCFLFSTALFPKEIDIF